MAWVLFLCFRNCGEKRHFITKPKSAIQKSSLILTRSNNDPITDFVLGGSCGSLTNTNEDICFYKNILISLCLSIIIGQEQNITQM